MFNLASSSNWLDLLTGFFTQPSGQTGQQLGEFTTSTFNNNGTRNTSVISQSNLFDPFTPSSSTNNTGTNNSPVNCLGKKTPVYGFFINGISVDRNKYNQDLGLIENVLKASGLQQVVSPGQDTTEADVVLDRDTYNLSGAETGSPGKVIGDFVQSVRQALSSRSDGEGGRFTTRTIDKIKNIDATTQQKAKEICCDTVKPEYLIIAHSQGNFFAEDILKGLPPEIQERTRVLAISPFTDFRGVENKIDYLLRGDDIPSLTKFLPGIAIPNNRSNLPNLPGIDLFEPHSLEGSYLDPNATKNSKQKQAVQESFNVAAQKVKGLLEAMTDKVYPEKKCDPINPNPTDSNDVTSPNRPNNSNSNPDQNNFFWGNDADYFDNGLGITQSSSSNSINITNNGNTFTSVNTDPLTGIVSSSSQYVNNNNWTNDPIINSTSNISNSVSSSSYISSSSGSNQNLSVINGTPFNNNFWGTNWSGPVTTMSPSSSTNLNQWFWG